MSFALGTAVGKIVLDYDGSGVDEAKKDQTDLEKKSGSTQKALDKTGRTAGIAGLAIAGGLALAVNAAANFDQRMSAIAAVSGATGNDLDALRGKALQLGKDTQFSATEAATAIEELVKAGVSVPDVLNGAADAVVNLAAAGEIDLPQAATISANAMNAFGLQAKDMVGVVDSIAGAANASAIDVGDFGQSLQQVGAVAHLAGVNFHDTAAAIAIMGNAGIRGSDAGTSLKTMFQRLQPTTLKQISTMEDLGILTLNANKSMELLRSNGVKPLGNDQATLNKQMEALAANLSDSDVGSAKAAKELQKLQLQSGALSNAFYDQHGNTKSLADVSQVLQDSMKGMNKQQKQMTLNTLFGSDAIRGAAILSEAGAKGFEKMGKSMDKVSAADVAAKRMDNLKGKIEIMKGSVETAGVAIGTALVPMLTSLVNVLTSVVNVFLGFSSGTQKAIVAVVAAVGAFLLLVSAIIKIVKFAKEAQATFLILQTAIEGTWIAALGPIALIIAAVIAFIAIVVILYKKWTPFRNLVNAVWAAIKTAISAVVDWFQGVPGMFGDAINAIQSFFSGLLDWLTSHWRLIISILLGPLGIAIALITKFWPQITAAFTKGVDAVKAVWEGFWNTFGGLITAAFQLVVAILNLAWVIVKGLFLLQLMAIKAIVMTVFNAIAGVVRAAFNIIMGIVHAAFNLWLSIVRAELNIIKGIFQAVWNAIHAVIAAVWGKIGGTITGALSRAKGAVSGAWSYVSGVTSRMWNAIWDAIVKAVGKIGTTLDTIKTKALDALSGAATWLFDKGKEIIQGLIDGMTSMIGKVTGAIHGITSKVSGFLPGSPVKEGPLTVLNKGYAGSQIINMIIDGITAQQGVLEATWRHHQAQEEGQRWWAHDHERCADAEGRPGVRRGDRLRPGQQR
jgi:phage-related protein